jgi:diguanylate cyclase (GGDEF)-like protein
MNQKALPPSGFFRRPSLLARFGMGAGQALRHGEARLRLLTRQMPVIIWSTDTRLTITSSLGNGIGWLALSGGDVVGRSLLEFFGTDDTASMPVAAHRRALEAEAVDFEVEWLGRVYQAHVEPSHGPAGEVTGTIGVAFDVTERRLAEAQARYTALHDDLTHLPNRALFLDRLDHALHRARRRRDPFALLLLDLDRFKTVNDSLGHPVGDRLLAAAARRLLECVRPGDTVSRLGGDEFTILLEEIAGPADPVRVAERVQSDLAAPFDLDGHEVVTAASIGIALGGPDYERAEEVLRDADIAMYRAKALGRGRYQVFDASMHAHAVAVLRTEMDLRRALERGEFRLYYQPIVSIAGGGIAGFEGLLRWDHPRRGLILPAEFLPLAEETGLMLPLGRWALDEGCRQMAAWSSRGVHVSLNISGRQLLQSDLVSQVGRTAHATGAPLERLDLEVTEDVLMKDGEAAGRVLADLKALALRVSIDDFGTGQSSLSLLHRLPIDTLKIDRSFVSDMPRRREAREIVRTVVGLGHNLGMGVVAEGVETAEQLKDLREMGCDYAQGFLFSQAVEPSAAEGLLGVPWPEWPAPRVQGLGH